MVKPKQSQKQEQLGLDQEIIWAYKVFDRNDKGINGFELFKVMNSLIEKKFENDPHSPLKPEFTQKDAENMIAFWDHDEDGVLDIQEFANLLLNKP